MPLFERPKHLNVHDGVFNDIQGNQFIINMPDVHLADLNHATAQFSNIDQHKAEIEILLNRIKDLLLEVIKQRSQTPLSEIEAEKVNRCDTSCLVRLGEAHDVLSKQCMRTSRRSGHDRNYQGSGLETVPFRADSVSTQGRRRCHHARNT